MLNRKDWMIVLPNESLTLGFSCQPINVESKPGRGKPPTMPGSRKDKGNWGSIGSSVKGHWPDLNRVWKSNRSQINPVPCRNYWKRTGRPWFAKYWVIQLMWWLLDLRTSFNDSWRTEAVQTLDGEIWDGGIWMSHGHCHSERKRKKEKIIRTGEISILPLWLQWCWIWLAVNLTIMKNQINSFLMVH